eukprot:CAMPEP_0185200420 /NCGR_PEP_ID=MMETSP1140-20130426/47216_1 /TAXON_ID=298111 /ORGANISM="Pavlova sp., Strain CCMP459" /LENGTH=133 /DNA_ID=CAMNT_0027767759 /DNA_START=50 /DNA_END=448 /DNA_ORIENTATION=-
MPAGSCAMADANYDRGRAAGCMVGNAAVIILVSLRVGLSSTARLEPALDGGDGLARRGALRGLGRREPAHHLAHMRVCPLREVAFARAAQAHDALHLRGKGRGAQLEGNEAGGEDVHLVVVARGAGASPASPC